MPPFHRKRLHRPYHRQSLRLLACQYRFHDLRRQQCHAQHPADVGRVDVLSSGDFFDGGEFFGLQQLAPAESSGERFDLRSVLLILIHSVYEACDVMVGRSKTCTKAERQRLG